MTRRTTTTAGRGRRLRAGPAEGNRARAEEEVLRHGPGTSTSGPLGEGDTAVIAGVSADAVSRAAARSTLGLWRSWWGSSGPPEGHRPLRRPASGVAAPALPAAAVPAAAYRVRGAGLRGCGSSVPACTSNSVAIGGGRALPGASAAGGDRPGAGTHSGGFTGASASAARACGPAACFPPPPPGSPSFPTVMVSVWPVPSPVRVQLARAPPPPPPPLAPPGLSPKYVGPPPPPPPRAVTVTGARDGTAARLESLLVRDGCMPGSMNHGRSGSHRCFQRSSATPRGALGVVSRGCDQASNMTTTNTSSAYTWASGPFTEARPQPFGWPC